MPKSNQKWATSKTIIEKHIPFGAAKISTIAHTDNVYYLVNSRAFSAGNYFQGK